MTKHLYRELQLATSITCKGDYRALPTAPNQGAAREHIPALPNGWPRELKPAVQEF